MSVRVMVDMSATLIHHGHIRLIKKAAEYGEVVLALTTDEEIEKVKGYTPELSYEERREILMNFRDVSEVVPCPWLIDEVFLDKHKCKFLAHGDDNVNYVPQERLLIFPRTQGVSSSALRERVLDSLIQINLTKKPCSSSDKIAYLLIETIKKEFRLE